MDLNASVVAGWMARGAIFAGGIATLSTAFNWGWSEDQDHAVAGAIGIVLFGLWGVYENLHAKGLAQKTALANEAVSSAESGGKMASPLAQNISTVTTGSKP